MYMVYSFFLVFIMMMLSVLLINNYKKSFLNVLKEDIKLDLQNYIIDKVEVITPEIDSFFME